MTVSVKETSYLESCSVWSNAFVPASWSVEGLQWLSLSKRHHRWSLAPFEVTPSTSYVVGRRIAMIVSVKETLSLEPCSFFNYRLRTSSVLGRRICYERLCQGDIIAGAMLLFKYRLRSNSVLGWRMCYERLSKMYHRWRVYAKSSHTLPNLFVQLSNFYINVPKALSASFHEL